MWLCATDLKTDKIVREFFAYEDEDIPFLNTALLQKGGNYLVSPEYERELTATSQFLRKMTSSNIGLSVYKNGLGQLELTIGAYEIVNRTYTSMSSNGSLQVTTVSFDPLMSSFSGYKNSKSVYFKTLIDPVSYKHIEGEVRDNAVERIADFNDSMTSITHIVNTETVYRSKGSYYYGYYSNKYDSYFIKRFAE